MTNSTLTGFAFVMDTRLIRVAIAAVLFAVMAATSTGCGHQPSPTAPNPLTAAPSSPPTPVPTTTTVPAAHDGEVGVYRSEITISHSGTATVTLRWADADFSLQLYVTSGDCADTTSLVTGQCTILGNTRQGTLPGVVTGLVTGGDRYTIWVLNPDTAPQSFSLDVSIE